jgi:hypothetical protein
MKRPLRATPGACPRAVSSRGRCVGKGECRAPNIFGLVVWTVRVLSHLILCFERLIFFYLFPYLLRLLARGIAMALGCRHKPATAGHQIERDGAGPTDIGASTDATT